MSRPKLVRADQPLPLRMLLHVYQFAASLKLAVVLISWLAVTLAVGTFVEAAYGTPVAQYGVYQTWWFNLLLVLLAVNIFSAASIRYPWKRYQIGFVITHIGLLTLLFGTALSRRYGIDAQLLVWEHATENWAMEEDMHIRMYVYDGTDASDGDVRQFARNSSPRGQWIRPIAYRPGPFSFRDYQTEFSWPRPPANFSAEEMGAFAKGLCHWGAGWMFAVSRTARTGEVIYDQDGIKLEVLDYLADKRTVRAPQITVKVSTPRRESLDESGKEVKSRYHWLTDTIQIQSVQQGEQDFPYGSNVAKGMFPGGTVSFSMTDQHRRLDAFQKCTPEGPLGSKGQVVLYVGGQIIRVDVAEKLGQGRFAIEGTGWEADLTDYWPAATPHFNEQAGQVEAQAVAAAEGSVNPCVQLALFRAGEPAGRLLLFSDQPGLSIHQYREHVYGDYWFDHSGKSMDERRAHGIGNRIDILQVKVGDEQYQLHYRRWDKSSVVASGQLSPGGTPETALDAFEMADQLKFFVHEHIPADTPQEAILPVPFAKDRRIAMRDPALKVRLTVDGRVHERWVTAAKSNPNFLPVDEDSHLVASSDRRKVSLLLPIDAVDIGFRVRLYDFDRRLDPGTSQPSHYSSTVGFWHRDADRMVVRADAQSGRAEPFDLPVVLEHDRVLSADQVALTAKYLFWIDRQARSIYRVARESPGGEPDRILDGRREPVVPVALAVDEDAGQLYWVEHSVRGHFARIRRANLSGKSDEALAFFSGRPTGLAIDTENEIVFWSYRKINPEDGRLAGAIGRLDFDGQNQQLDLVPKMRRPASIAVDPQQQRIYWTETRPAALRRADYDGGNVQRISLTGEQQPISLALDAKNRRLYWADVYEADQSGDAHETARQVVERHRIWTADLDGNDARVLAGRRVDNPDGLAVDPAGEGVWWTQDAIYKHNVWITMNAPVEYANPRTGQSYRLFQENFDGPYTPGSRHYETLVPKNVDAEDLYASVLTVNYDPGRWIRNIGCLLVVLGIATMFYMKAYLFRPRRRDEVSEPGPTPPQSAAQALPAGGKQKRTPKTPAEVAR